MKKRILTSVLLCALVLVVCLTILPTQAQAAGSAIKLTPSVTAAYPGDTVTVTVSVTGDAKFTSIGFIPKANSSVYDITKREILTGSANAALKVFDSQGAAAAFDTATVRTGSFFRYTLKIKSDAPAGSYSLADSACLKNGMDTVSSTVPTTKLLVAANTVTGTSGSVKWNLTKGTLTLTGSGALADFSATGAPWYSYRHVIKTVVMESGITKIGNNAFAGCSKLTQLTYKGSQTQWGKVTVGTGNDALKNAKHIYNGFFTVGDETYYGNNGTLATGWKTVNGKKYYFKVGTGGTMAKGWTTIGGKKYYFRFADGVMLAGYAKVGGVYQEFTADGVWVQEIPAPKITKQPASVKVAKGQTAKVSFTVSGKGLTYTWYYKNSGATSFSKTASFTSNSYSVAMDASRNGRQIYCVVTDKCGQTVKTNTVTISMAAAPKITKQPASVKAAKGKTASTSVTVTGEGLKYTWYVQNPGSTTWAKSSITKNAYSFAMDAAKSGRKVYCVVTDKYGQTVKTNTATLSMAKAIKITKQPASVKVIKGKTATVTVTATGESLKYTWYVQNPGKTDWVKSSITKSSYSFAMSADKSGRKVYCVVSDSYGQSVKSNVATMSLAPALKITKAPVSVKAPTGKNATVTFTVNNADGATYKWYYKDKNQTSFTYTGTFTTNNYTVAMTSARNGRQVYCQITDKYGQTVKTGAVTLSIAPVPKITKQPVSAKVAVNQTVSTSVTATGDGLKYTWYVKNPGSSGFTKSSVTKSTYSYAMTADKSGRQVYCVVTDKYGQTLKTSTVTLTMAAAPKITKQPASTRVAKGKTVTASVTATGEGLKYTWYVQNPGASSYTKSSVTSNTYSYAMAADKSGRKVYCVVTDKYGQTVKSNTVTLSMAPVLSITKQPANASASTGKSVTVSVTTTDCEGLTYKWYYKDKQSSTFTLDPEFIENTYSTAMSSAKSGRQVYCVVTDKYGQKVQSKTVTLSVK